MNKLAISINLLGLQGSCRATIKGEDCVVIRLPHARAKAHPNGKVYLNLDAMENKNGDDQYGNSHFVCEPLTKEERQSGAEKFPIIGNAKTFNFDQRGGQQKERPPQRQQQQKEETAPWDDDGSEIPF